MATKSQKAKAEFIRLMRDTVATEDRWGNFKATNSYGLVIRIKINKTSWRCEVKTSAGWARKFSAFYTATDQETFDTIENNLR